MQLAIAEMVPPVRARFYSPLVRMRQVSHGSVVRVQYGSVECQDTGHTKVIEPRLKCITAVIWRSLCVLERSAAVIP